MLIITEKNKFVPTTRTFATIIIKSAMIIRTLTMVTKTFYNRITALEKTKIMQINLSLVITIDVNINLLQRYNSFQYTLNILSIKYISNISTVTFIFHN